MKIKQVGKEKSERESYDFERKKKKGKFYLSFKLNF
jgi:hypothetical protein